MGRVTAEPAPLPASAPAAPTRREDDALLRGAGCYVHDVVLPGMLHLAFARSAHAHGRVLRLDLEDAARSPEVLAVLDAGTLGIAHLCMPAPNPLLPLEDDAQPAVPLMASQAVHYLGQPLAIVVARSRKAALRGADRVAAELEALPALCDFDDDAAACTRVAYLSATRGPDNRPPGTPLRDMQGKAAPRPDNASPNATDTRRLGDVPPATAEACRPDDASPATTDARRASDAPPATATTVHADLPCPRVLAMAMEPRACVADWDAGQQTLTAWLGTQTPSRAQVDLAQVLGIDAAQVRVIAPDVGGAFGARASVAPEDLLVAIAARHLGTPLRWAASRSEDFVAGMHGRGSRLQGQLSLDAQGRFVHLQARLRFTLGAWLPYSAVVPLRNAARILPGPYRVQGVDIQGRAQRSHAAPVTIYRGAGRPEAALLMETLVDLAARARGIDPVALRRRNLVPADAMPWTTPTGEVLDSGDYRAALDRACEAFGYPAERALQQARRSAGERVGIGVALYVEPCGQGSESARVTLHADGRATVASGAPAQGQGHATTFAQIAAQALGCATDAVTVLMGDTASCPPGTGALASRSTAIGGSAIVQACRAALARRDAGDALPITVDERYSAAEAWSYGCVVARMAVDPDTGTPQIERVVWVDDAGHIVNPTLAHGQLVGGAAQGLGQAMMERLVYDASGQLLTGSLMDYAVPRASDMPAIEIHAMETRSPRNLLGAKGVGEAGCIGLPAALLNAARDALHDCDGAAALSLPLQAEQLWRAMQGVARAAPEKILAA